MVFTYTHGVKVILGALAASQPQASRESPRLFSGSSRICVLATPAPVGAYTSRKFTAVIQ